jgi:hypothetical protein
MPEGFRAIVEGRPVWGTGAFSISVFGGARGCLLLMFRKSTAFYVFLASLFGAVVAQVPLVGMAGFPVEVLIGGLSQVVIGTFLIWYSKRALVI